MEMPVEKRKYTRKVEPVENSVEVVDNTDKDLKIMSLEKQVKALAETVLSLEAKLAESALALTKCIDQTSKYEIAIERMRNGLR